MRLRIDELAAKTGVTSRNIRAYREKGLLPAPLLVGRTGFYTEEHVQRLEIIEDLQERGFSLEAIRHTLQAWSVGGDFSTLLTLGQILNSPFQEEDPEEETVPGLLRRFPDALTDATLLQRAIDLGLVEAGDDNSLRLPSPLLIEAGEELTAVGVPLGEVLDLFERVINDMAGVAEVFVNIVERHLVGPIEMGDPGAPDPRKVVAALQRLRPLAIEVMRPILSRLLQGAIKEAISRLVEAVEAVEAGHEPER